MTNSKDVAILLAEWLLNLEVRECRALQRDEDINVGRLDMSGRELIGKIEKLVARTQIEIELVRELVADIE